MGCFNAKPEKDNEDERIRKEANKKIEKQLQKDKQTYRATHRLLLLGNEYSALITVLYLVSVYTSLQSLAVGLLAVYTKNLFIKLEIGLGFPPDIFKHKKGSH